MLPIPPERLIALHLVNKDILIGRAEQVADNWVRLQTSDGPKLINLDHVMLIDLNEGMRDPGPQIDEGLAKPRSRDIPVKVGSKAPGRPWTDEDLKQLSEGFLDGALDAQLAERFHRTRGQIRDLRQGFECNRGNAVEEQISPAATTWVARWHRVLNLR